MSQTTRGQNNTVIGVATIAADLHKVMYIAWSVSIAAKNAMIISAQAGEQARSFQPLTRFIDEIAHTTIKSTEKVEHESISLTRLSANYLRTRDAYTRFHQVDRIGKDARYRHTFDQTIDKCLLQLQEQTQRLHQQLFRLNDFMQDLDMDMRAALAVASVCRIEASRAGEYRNSLSVVADDLERAAREIQNTVKEGMDRIHQLTIQDTEFETER
ncbi:MAG: hypothetical protein OEX12_10400 [Gammaproteobacteria bacterium]|nr:hypothetical protein [Gammaproteobacteria bacterium]